MSAPREVKPSGGPKGAAAREFREGDALQVLLALVEQRGRGNERAG